MLWKSTASDLPYHAFFIGVDLGRTRQPRLRPTGDEYRLSNRATDATAARDARLSSFKQQIEDSGSTRSSRASVKSSLRASLQILRDAGLQGTLVIKI